MTYASFLIKPASGLCNMRCSYCFYEDEAVHREEKNTGIMTLETAGILVQEAFAQADAESVNFVFQGGEPTLAGLDYFTSFVELVKKHNCTRIPVSYAIQTNGLAVNGEWADFFHEHNFLVGLSLDGTPFVHDGLRKDGAGRDTWRRVSGNLELLQHKGVEVNGLCVVTRQCAKSPEKVYRTLKNLGLQYLQFIACLDPLGADRGTFSYSLTPEGYGRFLCGVFDLWYQDWRQGQYVSVRLFDDYVRLALGMPAGTCATSGACGAYFVVEGDGTVYPCDFYCLDQWRLGRLGEGSLADMAEGATEQKFLLEGRNHPSECAFCRWKQLCNGGCKRDWYQDEKGSHNYFCSAFQRFFAYAEERIREIARREMSARKQI